MLHSHSKLAASIPGACLFGVADEDEGKLKTSFGSPGLGRGEVPKIKGRRPFTGDPQLGGVRT